MHELSQQLKIRESALPTLKSKEAALRIEVKKAKKFALEYDEKLNQTVKEIGAEYVKTTGKRNRIITQISL